MKLRFVLPIGLAVVLTSGLHAAVRSGGPYSILAEGLDGGGGVQAGGDYHHHGSLTVPAGQAAGGAYLLASGFLGQLDGGSDPGPLAAEIVVEQAAGAGLTSSVSAVAFGSVTTGTGVTRTFVVRNTGTADLTDLDIIFTGASDFSESLSPTYPVAPGEQTSFSITFAPVAAGGKTATLLLASNDADEDPFVIGLTGTGLTPAQVLTNVLTTAGLSGGDAAPDATPYADGVENLLKYAFNMDLSGPDSAVMTAGGSSGLPDITAQPNGVNSVFRYEFVRRKNSGLIYTAQKSPELVNPASWVNLSDAPTVISLNEEWERVIYEETYDDSTTPRFFGRVVVNLP